MKKRHTFHTRHPHQEALFCWPEPRTHPLTPAPLFSIERLREHRPDVADLARVLRGEGEGTTVEMHTRWTARPSVAGGWVSCEVKWTRPVACAFTLLWPWPEAAEGLRLATRADGTFYIHDADDATVPPFRIMSPMALVEQVLEDFVW